MQPHELRINNWVKAINPVKHQPYVQLMSTGNNYVDVRCKTIGGVEGYAQAKFGDLEPIPLTPELLEKAGFTMESEDYAVLWHKESSLHAELIDGSWHVAFPHDTLIEVKYLHQLQNLFYALTGTEMEVSL